MAGGTAKLPELPAFLTKPEPRLDALPAEIWDNIKSSRQGTEDDEEPTILTQSDLIKVRLVNRAMWAKVEADFGPKLFATIKFMVTPWSLKMMNKIAESKYAHFVQEVAFGPERLSPGLVNPGLVNYLSLPRSVSGQNWSRATYEQWKKRHGPRIRQMAQEQSSMERTGADVTLILKALRQLPNIRSVTVETRFGFTPWEEGDAPSVSCGTHALLRTAGCNMIPRADKDSISREYQLFVLRDTLHEDRHFDIVASALQRNHLRTGFSVLAGYPSPAIRHIYIYYGPHARDALFAICEY
ncbi:hypothetical protein K491DRAFT_712577 [Lophiostoma macrostomum CBS 122681]|uniref:Uncharacterized protein n=1 Tax=Lophiostoma macrostomum CBS 122681 TaxID=1314788 RepID=A0A6A6THQ2_9PLEO|nr:hypothetical protein K491DRAFT_712577 [Lophiostoma macrostomum CBS 122681]